MHWLNARQLPGSVGAAMGKISDAYQAAIAVDNARLLHEIDATGVARIAVAPIPHQGLGEAINDRLLRAAAPRDMP